MPDVLDISLLKLKVKLIAYKLSNSISFLLSGKYHYFEIKDRKYHYFESSILSQIFLHINMNLNIKSSSRSWLGTLVVVKFKAFKYVNIVFGSLRHISQIIISLLLSNTSRFVKYHIHSVYFFCYFS